MIYRVVIKSSHRPSVFRGADTLCKSNVKKASTKVGSAAAGRENNKVEKYSNSENFHFVSVGIITYGSYGSQVIKLIKEIGKKIQEATGENLSTFYLMQSITMVSVCRGNGNKDKFYPSIKN